MQMAFRQCRVHVLQEDLVATQGTPRCRSARNKRISHENRCTTVGRRDPVDSTWRLAEAVLLSQWLTHELGDPSLSRHQKAMTSWKAKKRKG